MVLSVAASTTIALTVVEPTSKPTRNCSITISSVTSQRWGKRTGRHTALRNLLKRNGRPGSPTIGSVFFHQIANVQGKLRSSSSYAFTMGNLVKRVLEIRMLVDVLSQFVEGSPGLLQNAVEFGAGLGLGLCQRHLDSAVGVHFTFARGFDWKEDHVFELIDNARLDAIRLR